MKIILLSKKNIIIGLTKKVDNLVIYIPDDTTFEKVKIENGAGEINIQNINSKKMNLEIGAGKVEIENLNITDKIDIDGGAGEVKILSGIINDFDLDMGVGKFSITTRLTGKSEIDAGIGSIDINLTDNVENYKFMVSKGIGKITLNNKELQNDSEYGNGNNFLRIDGGIGDINIETNNNLGSNI